MKTATPKNNKALLTRHLPAAPRAKAKAPPRARNARRSHDGFRVDDVRAREIFGVPDTTDSGILVDDVLAMNSASVNRCVWIIASILASLPCKVYRVAKSGKREEADQHPVSNILEMTPDEILPSYIWRETTTAHSLLRDNGFSEIIRNGRGQGVQAHLLDPRRVQLKIDPKTRLPVYSVSQFGGKPLEFDRTQILHIPALTMDGLTGIGPVSYARQSIGLSLAADKYGAKFFGKGGRPMGFLTKPNRLTTPERKTLREEWDEIHSGVENMWNIGVLSGGLDWKEIGIKPADAEFLATRTFQVREIARWFGVPPHMLGDLEKASYNNIEHMMIEFVMFTLMPWIKRWESEINMKLFTRMERFNYYAEFQIDGLLRADSETRAASLEKQLRNGALTVNEWRKYENRPAYDEVGNKPLVMASQLATLEDVESGKLPMKLGAGTGDNTNGEPKPKKKSNSKSSK